MNKLKKDTYVITLNLASYEDLPSKEDMADAVDAAVQTILEEYGNTTVDASIEKRSE